MAFRPSLRAVLSPEAQEPARAALQADESTGTTMPWFVRLLAGAGAWLAALFLLAFLGLFISMFVGRSDAPVAIVMGLMLTGAATVLRHRSHHVFSTQLALSGGLAGQALFLYGVGGLFRGDEPVCIAAILLQCVVFVVYPDLLQRFLSVLFASLSLLYLLRETLPTVMMDVVLVGFAALIHGLFLRQGTLQGRPRGELVTPAAFGLVTTLFLALLMRDWFHDVYSEQFDGRELLSEGVLTLGFSAVTLFSAVHVMRETRAGPEGAAGVTVFVALILTALLTSRTPSIIAALGILMLGFHRRNVVLLGMAVVFVLESGTKYYYDLELTLLAKSLALLGSGLLMLGLRLFIARRFPLSGASS